MRLFDEQIKVTLSSFNFFFLFSFLVLKNILLWRTSQVKDTNTVLIRSPEQLQQEKQGAADFIH